MIDHKIIKELATDFYFYWHNQPGTNTLQGFDDFWEKHGYKYKLTQAYLDDRWVSASERLPEEGQTVIGIRDTGDKKIIDIDNWSDKHWKMNGYTHWMPLPPPPKSKQGDKG